MISSKLIPGAFLSPFYQDPYGLPFLEEMIQASVCECNCKGRPQSSEYFEYDDLEDAIVRDLPAQSSV